MSTAALLATLSVLFVAVGGLLAGVLGMAAALGLALLLNLVSYWYADRFVLRLYRAEPLSDPALERTLSELAREAKLPAPRLYRVRSDAPNAFATGRDPRTAAIAVTDGLLQRLSAAEVRAVLGHELAHVKNRDVLVASMAGVLAGALGFAAQIGYARLVTSRDRNLLGIVIVALCAPLAALIIRMAISRQREYRADATGAHISKDPAALASALKRIDRGQGSLRGPASTGSLWTANPFGEDWFSHLFRTHPPVGKRVERLERIGRSEHPHQ